MSNRPPRGDQYFSFDFPGEMPTRLDKFLVAHMTDLSRARIQDLIKDGFVLVNGEPAHKAGQALEKAARIEVTLPPPTPSDMLAEDIPLDIIFENDDIILINKPAGMVVHPAAGHASGTLVNAALAHAPEIEGVGGELRPGVVHRLDKETSGLILMAKNDRAHAWMQDQFRLRRAKKIYLALVDGRPPTPTGRIEAPIGRSTANRSLMSVVQPGQGKDAISEYLTLETFPQHTLLEVHLLTGRTHQIRVHMAFLGCPVAGDSVYGKRRSTIAVARHFLHAARLSITLPGESEPRSFEAPLPQELQAVLETLKETV